jgi:hypothetical protein
MTNIADTRPTGFGLAACIIGLFALVASVLPQWVLPEIYPTKSLGEVAGEIREDLKPRWFKRILGTENRQPRQPTEYEYWRRISNVAAISLSLITIALSLFSFLRREDWRYCGAGAALGIAAIFIQYVTLAIGALIVAAIIMAVLNF